MSLVVATSRLAENTAQTDAEKPAHFINYFRSPIEIEPDSEIAVESVKLKRSGNISINSANYFTHHWGEDPLVRASNSSGVASGTREGQLYQIHIPRPIQLPAKTYELSEYADKMKEVFNTMYGDPRIFNKADVTINTDSAGKEQGLDIKITQRSGSATNQLANTIGQAYFNVNRGNGSLSNEFSFNPANGEFLRNIAAGDAESPRDKKCVVILKNRPFALNDGTFTYEFANASANFVVVGLNRPFIQYKFRDGIDGTGAIVEKTRDLTPFKFRESLITYGGEEQPQAPRFHLDYGVMVSTQGVFIFNSAATTDRENFQHFEIKYWESGGSQTGSRMTKSAFYASYDRVRFRGAYDGISVFFGRKSSATYDQFCGPNLSKDPQECLKPITEATNALYPVISIGKSNVNTEVQDLHSYNHTYRFPAFGEGTDGAPHTYTPGDDFYSNNRVINRQSINERGEEEPFYDYLDNRPRKHLKGLTHLDRGNNVIINWQAGPSMSEYPFSGSNASHGVDYKHTFSIGRIPKSDPGFLGLTATQISSPNMSLQLGFPARALLTQVQGATDGYVTETTPEEIVFTSTNALEKGAQSSFIRLPGLTHKSFNGGQQALSKFVYHVPQFSNDGREVGNLFFAPGEKTYVALMNPTKILLNQLQVQIVDVNEKEINSLTGTTQVVFHIRKRK